MDLPTDCRLVIDTPDALSVIRDTCNLWEDLKLLQVQKPQNPEKIIQRIGQSRVDKSRLELFVPWGMRIKPGISRKSGLTKEEKALKSLNERLGLFLLSGIDAEILLMPADSYATEINEIPEEEASNYFNWLEERAESLIDKIQIRRWSSIKEESRDLYEALAQNYWAKWYRSCRQGAGFGARKYGDAARWLKAAGKRNLEGEEIAAKAAQYIAERLAEATIIERLYQPIKLSAANRTTDTNLDGDLPRLYLLPSELVKPWVG